MPLIAVIRRQRRLMLTSIHLSMPFMPLLLFVDELCLRMMRLMTPCCFIDYYDAATMPRHDAIDDAMSVRCCLRWWGRAEEGARGEISEIRVERCRVAEGMRVRVHYCCLFHFSLSPFSFFAADVFRHYFFIILLDARLPRIRLCPLLFATIISFISVTSFRCYFIIAFFHYFTIMFCRHYWYYFQLIIDESRPPCPTARHVYRHITSIDIDVYCFTTPCWCPALFRHAIFADYYCHYRRFFFACSPRLFDIDARPARLMPMPLRRCCLLITLCYHAIKSLLRRYDVYLLPRCLILMMMTSCHAAITLYAMMLLFDIITMSGVIDAMPCRWGLFYYYACFSMLTLLIRHVIDAAPRWWWVTRRLLRWLLFRDVERIEMRLRWVPSFIAYVIYLSHFTPCFHYFADARRHHLPFMLHADARYFDERWCAASAPFASADIDAADDARKMLRYRHDDGHCYYYYAPLEMLITLCY